MLGLLSALIEPVAKVLLKAWLGDASAEIGGGLIKYARDVLTDGKKAADAVRHARQIANGIVDNLGAAMEHEGIDTGAIETAAITLGETIGAHVDTGLLIGLSLKPEAVAQALLRARPIETVFAPSEPEYAAYRLMVGLLAERLCKVAPELPDYALERDGLLLARLAEVARDVPAVLARTAAVQDAVAEVRDTVAHLAGREQRQRSSYAADYCGAVRDKLDYVEILGLPELGPQGREARLSVAYLSLTASIPGIGRLGFEDLLDVLPLFGGRLLVEGAAGSGKSTLLRWTAVQAAGAVPAATGSLTTGALSMLASWLAPSAAPVPVGSLIRQAYPGGQWPARRGLRPLGLDIEIFVRQARKSLPLLRDMFSQAAFDTAIRGAWRKAIPFQMRLRHIDGGLPSPDDLPHHLSTALGRPPEGWVREQLKSGNVLLLIDGVDEVPEGERRQAAQQGIRDYLETYPDCLTIVTSRPGACDKALFGGLGFVDAEINELSDDQRAGFIDTWHRAFAERAGKPTESEITDLARDLKQRLAGQPQIARLATNPLLCAGICALHERSGQTLPKNEWDLCAKLTEMLADQRDRAVGRQGGMPQVALDQMFDYSVRRAILARLADAMVSQQLSALPREEAQEHVAQALRGVRDSAGVQPERVLDALAMRSGVLRVAGTQGEESRDAVEFVHNTLRSWLASLHCLEEHKPRELAARPLVTQVTAVVVFAAAAPNQKPYANALITGLLATAADLPDPEQRRALEVVALRCDAAAPVLDERLRKRLQKLATSLFPPKSFEEAQSLAAMGDLAVPRLSFTPELSAHAAACIRCLRLVATPTAEAALETYRGVKDMDALEELAQVFDPLTLPTVLELTGTLKEWYAVRPSIKASVRSLDALTGRTDIKFLGVSNTAITSIQPLSTLTNLLSLAIHDTQVDDLSPILGLTRLQSLYIDGLQIRDLTPIFGMTSLKTLWVGSSEPSSLRGIEQLQNLTHLGINGPGITDLTPLIFLPKLTELLLYRTGTIDWAPIAQLVGLRKLTMSGFAMGDVSLLAGLSNLTSLEIRHGPLRDLTALANMTALNDLDIFETEVDSLDPVMNLPNLKSLDARNTQLSQSEIDRFLAAVPGRKAFWEPRPPG